MYGLNWDKPLPALRTTFDARNEDMKRLFLEGTTLAAIGEKHGVTRERVRQILAKHYGIKGADGGESERARKRAAQRIAKQELRCQNTRGCSYVEYRMLVKHPDQPTRLYARARANWRVIAGPLGSTNGIKLWDWWCLWQESGHWADRGRGRFILCRKDISKGFTIDNVYIGNAADVSSETMYRYWSCHNAVSTRPSTRYWFSMLA